MSGLASDSFEASSRAAYETLARERTYPASPQDFLSKVSAFNKSLESLLVTLEDKIGRCEFTASASIIVCFSIHHCFPSGLLYLRVSAFSATLK